MSCSAAACLSFPIYCQGLQEFHPEKRPALPPTVGDTGLFYRAIALLDDVQRYPAVGRATVFTAVVGDRVGGPITLGGQPVGGDALGNQVVTHGLGAFL